MIIEDVTLPAGEHRVLDALREQDAPDVHRAVEDPLIRRWLPLPRPYPAELAVTFCTTMSANLRATGQGLIRAIRVRGEFAGVIDVKRIDWRSRSGEIGYWLAPWARGQGHMSAATEALSRWLLTGAGFERVELRIAPGNAGSLRVAELAGFTFEGTARNAGYIDAGRVDLEVFSRVPADLRGPGWAARDPSPTPDT